LKKRKEPHESKKKKEEKRCMMGALGKVVSTIGEERRGEKT